MRIESPRYTERFGSVRISDVQRATATLNVRTSSVEEVDLNLQRVATTYMSCLASRLTKKS